MGPALRDMIGGCYSDGDDFVVRYVSDVFVVLGVCFYA